MVELFAVFLLVVLAVGAARLGRARRDRDVSDSADPSRVGKEPRPGPAGRRARTPPFDAEAAHHLHRTRVLTGRAWIIDGDTIRVGSTQVRLFGIDAPELDHPYGVKSKWALHHLCKGHDVRAEITDIDAHGRTVARCYLPDGRDLSAEMVKQGMAIDWPKFSDGAYRSLEPEGVRRKLFLADARQKGRMDVWERFEARRAER